MNNPSKKLPNFGKSKNMFTPNLRYKRNVAIVSDQLANVNVKVESDTSTPSSSAQSSTQKSKKIKERSTTQIQSVFSSLSSSNQGSGTSHMGLSSGFRSYSNQGSFNSAGTFIKTEACQSIRQMQMLENNQLDVDDSIDSFHGPVRLPFSKKDRTTQMKSENSLDYPFQKNIYPSLTELITPESLMVLQFYDSSFSSEPKITDIDLTENGNGDTTMLMPKTEVPIKIEYNEHNIKVENDLEANNPGKPIGKVQYYRSGRVVLIFNGKEYELLKANEDKHHKELFSLTKVEAEKPDKLVSLGTIPLRLKALMDIDTIIKNF
ncbi:Hypothetical protein CINCED_3A017757 [Cinara cedri]|uniref:Uncharacterized protein n=1 Tax=Cinara cedri TaxID=506608 RepID=A0A5E4NPC4_9HEMI|nr:Hypothetical protein CINCED_3A017757 [Cinara cedri]